MAEEKQPCGCGENNMVVGPRITASSVTSSTAQPRLPGCTPTVSELVCVEADVTVTPTVEAGTPTVNCVGNPSTISCVNRGFTPSATGSCTFTISQVLCVNIPITFDADVVATPGQVACGPVSMGPDCPN